MFLFNVTNFPKATLLTMALPRDCHVARPYVDKYDLPLYYANNSNLTNVTIARLAMTYLKRHTLFTCKTNCLPSYCTTASLTLRGGGRGLGGNTPPSFEIEKNIQTFLGENYFFRNTLSTGVADISIENLGATAQKNERGLKRPCSSRRE